MQAAELAGSLAIRLPVRSGLLSVNVANAVELALLMHGADGTQPCAIHPSLFM